MFKTYKNVLKNNNILTISTTMLLTYGSFLSWFFLLPLYLRRMGATEDQIGTSYFAINFALCVFQFPGGIIADKIGRKNIIAYPTFLFPVLFLISAYTQNWVIVVVCITLAMLINGLQMPAIYSIIAESVKSEDRGLGFSIFEIAISASFALGPGIGSLIANSDMGIKKLIIASALINIPAAIARAVFMKETKSHQEHKFNFGQLLKSFNTDLLLCLMAFVFFAFMLNTTLYGPFITIYAKDSIKLTDPGIQKMFMSGGLLAIVFNFLGGRLTQKFGARTVMILGGLGHTLLLLPWLGSDSFEIATFWYVLIYLFLQLVFIGHSTILADLTETRTRSSIMGLFGLISSALGAFAPKLGTELVKYFGQKAPFYLAIIFAMLMIIYLLPIKYERN